MPYYYKGTECLLQYNTLPSSGDDAVLYTVEIDRLNPDPDARCVYANDAAGLSPMRVVYNEETSKYNKLESNGWEERFPFSEIKPCALLNGEFVGYLQPNNFKLFEDGTEVGSNLDESQIDVMVEIPKIYYCIETIDDKVYVHVSNKKVSDKFKCYAHVYDGIELDKIYIAVYESILKTHDGVRTFYSASDYTLDVTEALYENYENFINAKPEHYRIFNFDQWTMLQCLFLIAVKSTDCHTSFARAQISLQKKKSGIGDAYGMFYGDTTKLDAVKFAGIENLWGNMSERVEGVKIFGMPESNTYAVYKRDPYSNVKVNKAGDGYPLLCEIPELDGVQTTGTYLVDVIGTTEGGFLPKAQNINGNSGSDTTYYCDTVDIKTSYGLWGGGDYNDRNQSGIFCFTAEVGSNTPNQHKGYRLVYYPIGGNK